MEYIDFYSRYHLIHHYLEDTNEEKYAAVSSQPKFIDTTFRDFSPRCEKMGRAWTQVRPI